MGKEQKSKYLGSIPKQLGRHSSTLADTRHTGHEQHKEFELINMNGRMYDPVLGRMLSPDNYVQNASSTQNFNRYSYCLNNPLKYTDPTGNDYSPDWLLQDMEEASKEWFREQDKLYIGKFYHTSWSYGRQEIPGYGIQTKTNLYAIDTDWYNVDDDGTRTYTNTSTKYELRSEQELAWVGNGQDGETEPPPLRSSIAGNAQGNGGDNGTSAGQIMAGTLLLGAGTIEIPPVAAAILVGGSIAAGSYYLHDVLNPGLRGTHTSTEQPWMEPPNKYNYDENGGPEWPKGSWALGGAIAAGAAAYEYYEHMNNQNTYHPIEPLAIDHTYVAPKYPH